jgi:hypothetical protein
VDQQSKVIEHNPIKPPYQFADRTAQQGSIHLISQRKSKSTNDERTFQELGKLRASSSDIERTRKSLKTCHDLDSGVTVCLSKLVITLEALDMNMTRFTSS